MRFIRIKTVAGSEATLNADKIVSVTPGADNTSVVEMENGKTFEAKESNRVIRGFLDGNSEA